MIRWLCLAVAVDCALRLIKNFCTKVLNLRAKPKFLMHIGPLRDMFFYIVHMIHCYNFLPFFSDLYFEKFAIFVSILAGGAVPRYPGT